MCTATDTGAFFSGCLSLTFAVYTQALIFVVLNAAFVGIIFAHVGRAMTRANQIIFSDKATIRCVNGRFTFNFQVGEASYFHYHPIVEAHVRAYAVLHERTSANKQSSAARDSSDQALFQTRVLRITNPNDELGGMLFLPTPQLVSHRIDRWSPLFPPSFFDKAVSQSRAPSRPPRPNFPGLVLREDDVDTSALVEAEIEERRQQMEGRDPLLLSDEADDDQRNSAAAAATADATTDAAPTTSAAKANRVTSGQSQGSDHGDSASTDGLHSSDAASLARRSSVGLEVGEMMEMVAMREAIREHLVSSEVEIIVVVEGIDPASSNTFQARHSCKR